MRKPARLGIAAMLGAAWGIQAFSASCPQDCDEADKVNGCCPQAATTPARSATTPTPGTRTTKPPASAERPPATPGAQSLGGVRMVRVPAGTFQMGSGTYDGRLSSEKDEEPQHTVTISRDFYLMELEVTQALWQQIMGSTPWDQITRKAFEGVALVGPSYPAIYVSWCDAVLFANALSVRDGLTKAYSYPANFAKGMDEEACKTLHSAVRWDTRANGYRLPTEAEWEYAAREGAKGNRYAGANDEASVCRHANVSDAAAKARWGWPNKFSCNDRYAGPAPAGSFAANGWGLKDMTGNVSEWIFDSYKGDSYANSAAVDPVSSGDAHRVIRGGAWNDDPGSARVAYRSSGSPGVSLGNVGLRLARSVPVASRGG